MTRRSHKLILIIALTLVTCLIGYFVLRRPEPVYKDRKISAWLDDWAAKNKNMSGAWEAVRELGTNAIPYAVDNLALNDSSLHKKYRELWPKAPRLLQKVFPKPKPLLEIVDGANVFAHAGANSIPHAIALLKHPSQAVRNSAAWGLCALRRQSPAANQAIPALIEALNDSNELVRFHSCLAFAEMGSDASNAIPALTDLLNISTAQTNTQPYLRAVAAKALGHIGPVATNAIPALQNTLQIQNPYLRGQTAVAIWRISGDVDTTIPILLQEMPKESEHSKWDWIIALGEMGPQAKAAIPQLKKELKEDDQKWVLEYVTNAFLSIDPQTAAELGMKPAPAKNKK